MQATYLQSAWLGWLLRSNASLDDWPLLATLTSPLECQRRFGGRADQCVGATYIRGMLTRTITVFYVILHEASKEWRGEKVDFIRIFINELAASAVGQLAFVALDITINPTFY